MTIDDRPHLTLITPPDDETTSAPSNVPAERALLGHLLVNPTTANNLLPLVDPADFYQPRHETIWHTAATLNAAGTVPDHLALITALATDDHLTRAGGHEYLLELRAEADLVADPTAAAHQVRDSARIRHAMHALVASQTQLRKHGTTGIQQALENALDSLDTAVTGLWTGPQTTATGLVDLTWLPTGQAPPIPEPTWVHRSDGTALFYNGVVNLVFGDPESAKTWLAQIAIVEALHAGATAAMIDLDHNGADHTAARLLRLGAHPNALADPDRFRYYEPDEPDQLLAAVTDITARRPAVVLFDSLGELLPLLGVSSVDNDEITTALRRTLVPPAKAGSCVIAIDHLPKSHEARTTGYSIGGTAKKRMIRGSMLRAEVKAKPAPGAVGRITLRIEKDTLGGLRKSSGGGYVGTFVLDSTREDQATTTWEITREHAPITDDGVFRPTSVMAQVSTFIRDHDGCTVTDIREAINARPQTVQAALEQLTEGGFIDRMPGKGRTFHHHFIEPFNEDDHA